MAEPLPDKELGKRLSAGRAYTNRETTAAFARRIKERRQEVERWEQGEFGSDSRPISTARKRDAAIAKVQSESNLPLAFFRIKFSDLDAMAELWERVEGDEPSGGGEPRDLVPPADRAGDEDAGGTA